MALMGRGIDGDGGGPSLGAGVMLLWKSSRLNTLICPWPMNVGSGDVRDPYEKIRSGASMTTLPRKT